MREQVDRDDTDDEHKTRCQTKLETLLEQMESLVARLSHDYPVYLFGAGEKEKVVLTLWEKKYPNVKNMDGELENLSQELQFIGTLELMVTMDSGNMHLASLAGTRTLSIWGRRTLWAATPVFGCHTIVPKCVRFGEFRKFLHAIAKIVHARQLL